MTAVLLLCPMRLDAERRGPSIRYWEFARVLSGNHEVTLLVPNPDHPRHPDFEVRHNAGEAADALMARHQVVVVQGPVMHMYPRVAEILGEGKHYVVADLYDPITLEQLAVESRRPIGRFLQLEYWALLNQQLRLGDFFLCANEHQRDYWLGALSALGRLNHDTWDGKDFRTLIDMVPFGIPARSPKPGPAAVKGVVPGVSPTDRVILWGGGLWDWLDPTTPVRAMARVAAQHPDARLVFFATTHGEMPVFERTRQLAAELGLLDRHVVFADWLPADRWATALCTADVGLSFHPAGIETHFAFRTRLLDYIWAGLPIITASGDVLSKVVIAHGLGHVIAPGDVDGLADALSSLLGEPDARERRAASFREVATGMVWDRVTTPLARYCQAPWRAGDAGDTFVKRWQAATRDEIVARMGQAEVERTHLENTLGHMQAERDHAIRHVAVLQQEWDRTVAWARALEQRHDDLARQLAAREAQLTAAMNGRVMRLMTGVQEAARRLLRREP